MPSRSELTLDDLLALNGELAAVVRAGVPIDLGLAGSGTEWRSNLARLTERLAVQVQQGRSLSEALADEKSIPPMYRAVVDAGARAGRLPEALEGLSRFVLLLQNMRQQLRVTLITPAIVIALAYLVWLGFLKYFVPEVITAIDMIRRQPDWLLTLLGTASRTLDSWFWIPPLAVVIVAFAIGRRGPNTAATPSVFGLRGMGLFGFLPGIRRLVQSSELAAFSELTGLLVAHETPLPEALELSAAVLGDESLRSGAAQLIAGVRAGNPLQTQIASSALPPYFRWLLQTGLMQGRLAQTLAEGADYYRRKASSLAQWAQVVYPAVIVAFVCGTLLLMYCLTLFLPYRELIMQYARP